MSEFNQIWEFLHRLSKKSPMCNFTEIPLVGAALIHADGQTHRQTDKQTEEETVTTKLAGAFRDMRTYLKSPNLTEDFVFPFP